MLILFIPFFIFFLQTMHDIYHTTCNDEQDSGDIACGEDSCKVHRSKIIDESYYAASLSNAKSVPTRIESKEEGHRLFQQ